ncbi:RNA-binding domain-containing protein [Pseudomonas brassicacearum]|uniref:RNA-binding domain-containing protein n=1 Tax=Pseudomonas brassicacearum TaxID=930166 RepID=UPI0011CE7BD0|nr:ATP-binding protein [Pseudomonas brassicacearum]
MEENFNIGSCKVAVAKHIEVGVCNRSVVDLIRIGNYFAPIECEIIDYKEFFSSDVFALAKLIRHVVAFYNAFGGHLIFGVKETVPNTTNRFE